MLLVLYSLPLFLYWVTIVKRSMALSCFGVLVQFFSVLCRTLLLCLSVLSLRFFCKDNSTLPFIGLLSELNPAHLIILLLYIPRDQFHLSSFHLARTKFFRVPCVLFLELLICQIVQFFLYSHFLCPPV